MRDHTHICIYTCICIYAYKHTLKHARTSCDAALLPDLIRRLHNRVWIDGMALLSPVHESEHVQENKGRLCKDWCMIWVPVHTLFLYPSAELRLARVCTDAMFPASRWWGSDTHSTAARAVHQTRRDRPDHGRPVQTHTGTAEKKTLQKIPDVTCFWDTGAHECFVHTT